MRSEIIFGDYDLEYVFDTELRPLCQIRSLVGAVRRITSSNVQRVNEDECYLSFRHSSGAMRAPAPPDSMQYS